MIATISNRILLQDIPPSFGQEIMARLTIQNPKWTDNEKMGRWNGKTLKFLKSYTWTDQGLSIPRGFLFELADMAEKQSLSLEWEDRTREMPEVDFEFRGELRPYQAEAVEKILSHRDGVLQAPTGSGKTVMALHVIAERKQPALIICHTKELLNQWIDRIHAFLDIPVDEIGTIGAGKMRMGDRVTVAMVQSLYKCANDVSQKIGFLICDECHRAPSRTFTAAVSAFDSKYMLGLSATPYRRDGLTELIYWYLGDLIHEVDRDVLQDAGHILKAEIVWRETDFRTDLDPSHEYSRMLSELTQDASRNALIAADAAREARNGGGVCLILSDRKEHAATLAAILNDHGITETALLTGDTPRQERENVVERLNKGQVKAVCATGQLIGEGFDCKGLSSLFMGTPIKFDGRVLQYVGRILRPATGKDTAKVFDYVDSQVGVLAASAKARAKTYLEAGDFS